MTAADALEVGYAFVTRSLEISSLMTAMNNPYAQISCLLQRHSEQGQSVQRGIRIIRRL